MKDVKEKTCGCLIFEVGPPVLCEKHRSKQNRKDARQQRRDETAVRKAARKTAFDLGHDLSEFREYGSMPGKWVCHCHGCGALVIVYDPGIRTLGDQVSGRPLTDECAPKTSSIFKGLEGIADVE